ncbi:MarR family transcriptional regulator [Azospirillum picis]|uniref:DNA-binding MarR family transcriptional regulator n=1 Tax=Azospirillum picis TaxID=488438 RepID=A0ABU0MKV3_9PROT|nr:MarR family transcriptional regulator [Azospirillum picis]MBP2300303.1 DNA-binding MarR family transcriptional regulator [Azospirillum picis]MDQ0534099.1 DNA-binding MarR family transcriptional regulator [Azospirillum picis]
MPARVRHDEVLTIVQVLEAFRKLDPDLPIQYALSFMTIAQSEGISIGELAERLGIAQSSASRNVAALSRWHSFGKAGLDLVQAQEDPRERRRKVVTLTDKGHAFLADLRAIINPAAQTAQTQLPRVSQAPQDAAPVAPRRATGSA